MWIRSNTGLTHSRAIVCLDTATDVFVALHDCDARTLHTAPAPRTKCRFAHECPPAVVGAGVPVWVPQSCQCLREHSMKCPTLTYLPRCTLIERAHKRWMEMVCITSECAYAHTSCTDQPSNSLGHTQNMRVLHFSGLHSTAQQHISVWTRQLWQEHAHHT